MENINIILISFFILIFSIANGYILNWLYLQKRTSHEGIFKSKTLKVVFPQHDDGFEIEPEHIQRVAFPDYVRRVFGAYDIKADNWVVSEKAEVFTCRFCLSFWTSIIFSGLLLSIPFPAVFLLPFHFCIAGLSVMFAGAISHANHA